MKLKHKIINSLLALLTACGMIGCSTNEETNKWKFTKEETTDFADYYGEVVENEGKHQFVFKTGITLFSQDLTKENILFFNVTNAFKEFDDENNKSEYLDYSIIKNHLVEYTDLKTYENCMGFELTFNYDSNYKYGTLIHKDIVQHGSNDAFYALVTEYTSDYHKQTQAEADQDAYEKKYAESTFTWDKGGSFTFQLLANIGTIVAGVKFAAPVSIITGVFSLLTTLGNGFLADGPTNRDILNKLIEMDKKLDTILSKIDQNHTQLMQETIRTQTMVDLVLLNQQKQTISQFNTNYVEKVDDSNRNMGVIYQNSYKDFVSKSQEVDVYLYLTEDGSWGSRLLSECGTHQEDVIVSVNIASFPNANKFLDEHQQIISDGFIDALYKDIDASIDENTLLPGLEKESLRYFVSSMIIEQFSKEYFSTHQQEAQDFANQMINMSKRYSGKSDDCISMTYLNRFKYMYNFGSELKKPMTTFTAKHMYFLDTNVAKAIQACTFAKINYDEIIAEYKAAREALQKWYKATNDIPDNYFNILNIKLNGTFYKTDWVQYYSNPGSHAILNARLNTERYVPYPTGGWTPEYVRLNERAFMSELDHSRILTRLRLLKELGLVKADRAYIDYLVDGKVMPEATVKIQRELVASKQISPNSNRFFTSYSVRALNDSDKGKVFYSERNGNPGGNYFKIGCLYKFKEAHKGSCWFGEVLETTWLDGNTGSVLDYKEVRARAWYEEHHWYWRNDELWCFSNYTEPAPHFFGLEKA